MAIAAGAAGGPGWTDILGTVAVVATAVIAAWAAWQSRSAAREANKAARTLAQIEVDRRHAELTPVLEVSCEEKSGIGTLRLTIRLAGPPGLDRVDTLTVTIRDDSARRAGHLLPGGPAREDVERHVWGPCRLQPGAGPDGILPDETGRSLRYNRPLPAGESILCFLEQTGPPRWSAGNGSQWRETVGTVLRLSFTMTHAEHGPWTLPGQLDLSEVLRRKGPVRTVLPTRL